MAYLESKSDSNSLSIFSKSESKSDSHFNSAFINLDVCIFFALYLHSSK